MRSSRIVPNVWTSLCDRPPRPELFTQATTDAWCTSRPAQQATTTSMFTSLLAESVTTDAARRIRILSCVLPVGGGNKGQYPYGGADQTLQRGRNNHRTLPRPLSGHRLRVPGSDLSPQAIRRCEHFLPKRCGPDRWATLQSVRFGCVGVG